MASQIHLLHYTNYKINLSFSLCHSISHNIFKPEHTFHVHKKGTDAGGEKCLERLTLKELRLSIDIHD